jgi:hypothetical protein
MLVVCPHCKYFVWIDAINCRIFRHAVYKANGEPINPHATEKECSRLLQDGLVYGCAMPFLLNAVNEPEICDYF